MKIRTIGTENADSGYCTIFRALQQKLILRSYHVRKGAFEDMSKYRLTGTIAQTKGNSRFAAIFQRWRFSAFQNYKRCSSCLVLIFVYMYWIRLKITDFSSCIFKILFGGEMKKFLVCD